MDLDEWEFIPADSFLSFHDDGEKSISLANSKSVFDMNYFNDPLPSSTLVPLKIPINPEPVVKEEAAFEAEQDSVSQVFFKKETEFVDMKMDSPESPTAARGFVGQIEASSAFRYEESVEGEKERESGDDGINMWKLSLTGVGAIFSFGLAATICILFLGNPNTSKHKIRFQIYDDVQRMKKVVHHSTKMNEAISAVRGVPLTRAHVTFGGYYDAI